MIVGFPPLRLAIPTLAAGGSFMKRLIAVAVFAAVLCAAPSSAAGIKGQYIDARTCDTWTGPCFANAELNLAGTNPVLSWKLERGAFDQVNLAGLGVLAVLP